MDRPTDRKVYPSRDAFLRDRATLDKKVCHVRENEGGGTQPWPTIVIGSGCTASTRQLKVVAANASRVGAMVARSHPEHLNGVAYAQVVTRFANDLIRDRLRLPKAAYSDEIDVGKDPGDVPAWMGDVFLLAALLTRLYYELKFLSDDAPRRTDHGDEAALTPDHASHRLDEKYLVKCRALLKALRRSVPEIAGALNQNLADKEKRDDLETTAGTLFARLISQLSAEEVCLAYTDVQSLAEFSWFCLTTIGTPKKATTIYPGWSDLLLDLSNYHAGDAARVGNPIFKTMADAEDIIQARYEEITRVSWSGIVEHTGDPHPNHSFYIEVARLLEAQWEVVQKDRKFGHPPPAVAFGTSFDVELELALLSLQIPFTVAIPVHVVTVHNQAHACWLAVRVRKAKRNESSLDELIAPELDQVSLLDESATKTGPLVVRLAGCPLITLPELKDESPLRKAIENRFEAMFKQEAGWALSGSTTAELKAALEGNRNDIFSDLQLQHAVVINEHDAMLQNNSDLLPPDNPVGRGSEYSEWKRRAGLAPQLVTGGPGWSRFWMLLGVQIRDSALRHRIATLVTSLPRASMDAGAPKDPVGVAVNAYITELELDLLLWSGFDAVHGEDVTAFAEDVKHFRRHLEQFSTKLDEEIEAAQSADPVAATENRYEFDKRKFKAFTAGGRCRVKDY